MFEVFIFSHTSEFIKIVTYFIYINNNNVELNYFLMSHCLLEAKSYLNINVMIIIISMYAFILFK